MRKKYSQMISFDCLYLRFKRDCEREIQLFTKMTDIYIIYEIRKQKTIHHIADKKNGYDDF
jgi:hypothetical protein